MTNWKPDEKFLDWFLEESKKEGDVTKPMVGFPDGTKKGGEGYSLKEIVKEMKKGNEQFKRMYAGLELAFGQEYESYKSQHP
ncbi:hypothetical protein HY485_01385 [Candidatus Woesearchaeota archaeon]|nr:hypothetical protein [Candidatus Woesearchaeota archaeon]